MNKMPATCGPPAVVMTRIVTFLGIVTCFYVPQVQNSLLNFRARTYAYYVKGLIVAFTCYATILCTK